MADGTNKPILDGIPGNKQAGMPGLVSEALRKYSMNDDNMIPAKVVAFDRDKNIVTVQPMIMWVRIDDQNVSRAQLADLNCISIGGGGFHISFPLKADDLGWIVASDRDLALFKANLEESPPNTNRFHSFSDALFIPDVFRKYVLDAGEKDAAMVIQSTDAATRIAIFEDQIRITAPTIVKITTPLTEISQDVHIKGNLVVDKNTTVSQNLTVTQNATISGLTSANGGFTAASGQPCTLPASTTVAGKTVNGHIHTDPQGGSTGPF